MSALNAHLLFDSISRNTGDIAIGLASQQLLGDRGIAAAPIDPFGPTPGEPLVIGGGEIIRTTGDTFYDAYRRRGGHILNAAGVWSTANDLDYLNGYRFVSARSTREVETLSSVVADVNLLPCATTVLRSDRYVIEGLDPDEPVVGIHLVPHSVRVIEDLVALVDAIPHKKVFIPFTHYNSDASFMKALPFDRSNSITLGELAPLQLHSVIGQMSSVIVNSLHASIFAYSQNVPFVSIHQPKAADYFADRGLGEFLVRNRDELAAAVDRIEMQAPDFSALIEKDASAIESAFDRYAEMLRDAPVGEQVPPAQAAGEVSSVRDQVLFDQVQHVVADRDLSLGHLETRRAEARAEATALQGTVGHQQDALARLQSEIDRQNEALEAAHDALKRYRAMWMIRGGRVARRVLQKIVPAKR